MARSFRRRGGRGVRFIANAIDGDNDGFVQDETPFQRPATPRSPVGGMPEIGRPTQRGNRFLNPGGKKPNPIDFDEFLQDIEKNQRDRRRRIDPDDLDRPSDIARDLTRGRGYGQARPSETANEEPKKIVSDGLTRAQWNGLVDDLMDYFSSRESSMTDRDQRRALFKLISAVRSVEASEENGKLTLQAKPSVFERISRSLRGVSKDTDSVRNLDAIRDFLKANKSDDFDLVEVKRLGRKLRRRGIERVVRRYVRNARFNRDAVDADGDGIVQEGTQFARRVNATARNANSPRMARRLGRLGETRRRALELVPFLFDRVKKRDAEKVQAAINDIVTSVETKHGKIRTARDAASALKDSHPNIRKMPDFLRFDQDRTLSPEERGSVIGWLHAFERNPVLADFSIAFERSDGNSQKMRSPIGEDGSIKGQSAEILISFNQTRVFTIQSQQEMINTNQAAMDMVANQVSLAVASVDLDDPANRDAIRGQVDESIFSNNMFVALHELMGHGVNFAQAHKDVFGDKDADAVKKQLEDIIDEQGERLLEPAKTAQGIDMLQNFKKNVYMQNANTIQQLISNLDNSINNNPNYPTQQQKDMAFTSALSDEKLSKTLRQIAGRSIRTRADLVELISELRKRHKLIRDRLDDKKDTKYAKLNKELKRAKHAAELSRSSASVRALIRDLHKLVSVADLSRDDADGEAEYERQWAKALEDGKYAAAYQLSLARRALDDLSKIERQQFETMSKLFSEYGSKPKYSYYDNVDLSMPVEAVAEVYGALLAGVEPQNSSQKAAVKKLLTWLYGDLADTLVPD